MFKNIACNQGRLDNDDIARIRFIPSTNFNHTSSVNNINNMIPHNNQINNNNSKFSELLDSKDPVDNWLMQALEGKQMQPINNNSCPEIILKQIPVQALSRYQLILDVDVLWNSNEELAPPIFVTIRSATDAKYWHHEISKPITQKFPTLGAEFCIPQGVHYIDIWLQVKQVETNNNNYQIAINVANCRLHEQESNMEREWSWKRTNVKSWMDHNPINLQPKHTPQIKSIPSIDQSPLYSLVEHCYMIHVPSTPIHRFQEVEMELNRLGVMPQIIYNPSTAMSKHHLQNQGPALHDAAMCSKCFYESEEWLMLLNHTRDRIFELQNQNSATVQDEKSPIPLLIQSLQEESRDAILEQDTESIIDGIIKTLQHAIENHRQSIMIVRDDIALHCNWDKEVNTHLNDLPEQWAVILFGAPHASDSSKTLKNAETWLDRFYSVDEHHLYASFAFALNGTAVLQKALDFFIKSSAEGSNPLLLFNKFLLEQYNDSSFVWYPNLISLNVVYSHHYNTFHLNHQASFDTFTPTHPLFWNSNVDYRTGKSSVHHSLRTQHIRHRMDLLHTNQRCIHVVMMVDDNAANGTTMDQLVAKLCYDLECFYQQIYPYWKLHLILPDRLARALNESSENTNIIDDRVVLYSMKSTDSWFEVLNLVLETLPMTDLLTFQQFQEWSLPQRLNEQMHNWLLDARFSVSPLLKLGTSSYFPNSDLCVATYGATITPTCTNASLACSTLFGSVFTIRQVIFRPIYEANAGGNKKATNAIQSDFLLKLLVKECPRLFTLPAILVAKNVD
jgi:hypothetical protein